MGTTVMALKSGKLNFPGCELQFKGSLSVAGDRKGQRWEMAKD